MTLDGAGVWLGPCLESLIKPVEETFAGARDRGLRHPKRIKPAMFCLTQVHNSSAIWPDKALSGGQVKTCPSDSN